MVTFGLDGRGAVGVTTAGLLEDRSGGREIVSSGWPALDGLLPGGGVRRGSLIEWFAGDTDANDAACGAGAATLACAVACRVAATRHSRRGGTERSAGGGLIVVVDRAGWFHPPAVLPWLGMRAASRLVVARPSRDDDEIWAIEQALRCAGVAAVVAWPRLAATWSLERGVAAERRFAGRGGLQQWTTAMRRWQLAARSGGAVGLFVRPPAALREPSWAESRLAVTAACGGSLVERRLCVARVGGAWCGIENGAGRPVEIMIDLANGRAAGRAGMAVSVPSAARGRVVERSGVGVEGGASCRAS